MRISAYLFFVVSLALPVTVAADDGSRDEMDPSAKPHYERAIELFGQEKYRRAADSFYRAYRIDDRIEILFGWAQSKRFSGDCSGAVELYGKLLRRDLLAADEKAVREGLKACGVEGEEVSRSRPRSDNVRSDSEPAPPPARKSRDEKTDDSVEESSDDGDEKASAMVSDSPDSGRRDGSPWYKDPVGDALLISGVVGLGVGIGYFLVSSSDRAAADEATSYESYTTLADRASTRRTVAIVATSASVGLVIGAIVRYATRDSGSERGTAVSAWGQSGGGGIAFGGSF